MVSWPLLISSLEPPTCPWNIHVRYQRLEHSIIHAPTQLWPSSLLLLFLVLYDVYFACWWPSDFLPHVCAHFILGFDPGHHSSSRRPVFPGQVGLLLHLALGVSGHPMQMPLVFVLIWRTSNPSSKF